MSIVRSGDVAPSPLDAIELRDAVNRAMDTLNFMDRIEVVALMFGFQDGADDDARDRIAEALEHVGVAPTRRREMTNDEKTTTMPRAGTVAFARQNHAEWIENARAARDKDDAWLAPARHIGRLIRDATSQTNVSIHAFEIDDGAAPTGYTGEPCVDDTDGTTCFDTDDVSPRGLIATDAEVRRAAERVKRAAGPDEDPDPIVDGMRWWRAIAAETEDVRRFNIAGRIARHLFSMVPMPWDPGSRPAALAKLNQDINNVAKINESRLAQPDTGLEG